MTVHSAYLWARRSFGLFALMAIMRFALFFVNEDRTAVLLTLLAGLAAALASVGLLLFAVSRDGDLDPLEARRMRLKLLMFGPLGALEILLSRWRCTL